VRLTYDKELRIHSNKTYSNTEQTKKTHTLLFTLFFDAIECCVIVNIKKEEEEEEEEILWYLLCTVSHHIKLF